MINRQALIAVLAATAAIQNTSAFAPSANLSPLRTTSLYSSASGEAVDSKEEDVELTRQVIMAHIESTDVSTETEEDEKKPIMDIPPMPIAVEEPSSKAKPAAAKKVAPKKKKSNPHKEGVFSPIVIAAGAVLGDEQLNKIRAKIISLHSDVIRSFVDTSDSEFGKAVLRQLFRAVDTDNSGYLDKEEVAVALNMLGFKWLGEKQVEKIFARADADGDLEISLEEFMEETPKTLRVNLVKLAKNNGGEMGLLVAPPKKKKGNPHKEGVFSPIVVVAGAVLGDEQLNKIRAKIISLHSDIIRSFVDTSDSEFGKAVLRQLFDAVDADNSGYLDKEEVAVALNMLGFKWLGEKQVEKIFARADANGDSEISLEEFMEEAPKTLRVNLVKLAKNNGGEMGLLV